MPSDDEQPLDPIRKRNADPADSERLQLYWYSQSIQKQPKKNYHCGSIRETNQLQLSSSKIHTTRRLLNHSFHYYKRIQTQNHWGTQWY